MSPVHKSRYHMCNLYIYALLPQFSDLRLSALYSALKYVNSAPSGQQVEKPFRGCGPYISPDRFNRQAHQPRIPSPTCIMSFLSGGTMNQYRLHLPTRIPYFFILHRPYKTGRGNSLCTSIYSAYSLRDLLPRCASLPSSSRGILLLC